MILIGQYDSPFVRRVGIALTLYRFAFEHRPWSVFGDGDKIRALNPVMRVPTLVLDDGTVLTDSHIILDYLDGLAGEAALFPRAEPARHKALRIATLAMGAAEKAVSLFYEKRLHDVTSPVWIERCSTQIGGILAALEADRADHATAYWFGDAFGHADIAVAVMLRFLGEAHPGLFPLAAGSALAAHAARLETLPVFQAVQQPFIPPA
jgi:glutathione S-transferase